MNIGYIISHGENGCTVTYEEISALSDLVVNEYYFSAPRFWMWKMFQLGFAYGKHEERAKKKEISMERMIMIPEDRYNRMMKSYDEVMEELIDLREQLKDLKVGVALVSKD